MSAKARTVRPLNLITPKIATPNVNPFPANRADGAGVTIMRIPIFRVVCDDYGDPAYPCAVSLPTLYQNGDPTYDDVCTLRRGESITVGGGASVQFKLTRIR